MHKIIQASIFAVIGILVFAALLIPVINGATDTEATINNKGAKYALYETGETHTITFTADSMITDGVAQPIPDTSVYGGATIAYGEGGFIRISYDNNLYWWGSVGGSGSQRYLGPATSITITIDDTGRLDTTGASTNRGFGGTVVYPNPNGNLALTYNPYVLEDSHIYGAGATTVGGVSYGVIWDGTISEITATGTYPPDQEFGDITVTTTNPATNLLKVSSVVIPDVTAGESFTYTYFYAPATLTYDNPGYVGVDASEILGVVPLVLIISLIMGIVGVALYQRIE